MDALSSTSASFYIAHYVLWDFLIASALSQPSEFHASITAVFFTFLSHYIEARARAEEEAENGGKSKLARVPPVIGTAALAFKGLIDGLSPSDLKDIAQQVTAHRLKHPNNYNKGQRLYLEGGGVSWWCNGLNVTQIPPTVDLQDGLAYLANLHANPNAHPLSIANLQSEHRLADPLPGDPTVSPSTHVTSAHGPSQSPEAASSSKTKATPPPPFHHPAPSPPATSEARPTGPPPRGPRGDSQPPSTPTSTGRKRQRDPETTIGGAQLPDIPEEVQGEDEVDELLPSDTEGVQGSAEGEDTSNPCYECARVGLRCITLVGMHRKACERCRDKKTACSRDAVPSPVRPPNRVRVTLMKNPPPVPKLPSKVTLRVKAPPPQDTSVVTRSRGATQGAAEPSRRSSSRKGKGKAKAQPTSDDEDDSEDAEDALYVPDDEDPPLKRRKVADTNAPPPTKTSTTTEAHNLPPRQTAGDTTQVASSSRTLRQRSVASTTTKRSLASVRPSGRIPVVEIHRRQSPLYQDVPTHPRPPQRRELTGAEILALTRRVDDIRSDIAREAVIRRDAESILLQRGTNIEWEVGQLRAQLGERTAEIQRYTAVVERYERESQVLFALLRTFASRLDALTPASSVEPSASSLAAVEEAYALFGGPRPTGVHVANPPARGEPLFFEGTPSEAGERRRASTPSPARPLPGASDHVSDPLIIPGESRPATPLEHGAAGNAPSAVASMWTDRQESDLAQGLQGESLQGETSFRDLGTAPLLLGPEGHDGIGGSGLSGKDTGAAEPPQEGVPPSFEGMDVDSVPTGLEPFRQPSPPPPPLTYSS